MKKFVKLFPLIVTSFILISCSKIEFNKTFECIPSSPQSGNEVFIKFKADQTKLDKADSIEMIAYVYKTELDTVIGRDMERLGSGWVVKLDIPQNARGVMVKFVNGNIVENNGGKGYHIFVYDASGNLVPGAKAGLGVGLSEWAYYLDMDNDVDAAYNYFNEEFTANPQMKKEYISYFFKTYFRVQPENAKKEIMNYLKNLELKEDKNESELNLLADWYSRFKKTKKAEKYQDELIKRFPNGNYAELKEYRKIRKEKNINKKLKMLLEFNNRFPNSKYSKVLYDLAANYYRDNKEYEKAKNFITKYGEKASIYRPYSIVTNMIENNADLNIAEDIADMGIKRAEAELNNPSVPKPKHYSDSEWLDYRKYMLGLNMYAKSAVLIKTGNTMEAEKILVEAVDLTNKEDQEIIEAYAETMLLNNEYKIALDNIGGYIKDGKSSNKLKELMKEAYIKDKGNDTGFKSFLSIFESAAEKKLMEELKSKLINMPAPKFTLKDLEGKDVSLENLTGKIVVVDFWATWCGPCVSSFPAMKKAVEKYSGRDDVKFLFVNTWERVKNIKKNAADFIRKNNYPFRVLLDEKNTVVSEFKVSGIPTKFIIDKNGVIRFKSVGYSGSEDGLVDEISAMISLLDANNI